MRTLLVSLGEHTLAMLRGIAEVRGVSLASNSRDEVAAQLAAALGDEAATAAAIQDAPAEAQVAWNALRRAGGKMKVAAFARQFGEIRPVGPGRLEREALWRTPETAAEALWYRALIFRAFADFGEGPMEYVYIPEDLPLPPVQQSPPTRSRGTPLATAPSPARSRHALNSLAVDTCTVLAYVRETPLEVSDVPSTGEQLLDAVGQVLLMPDAGRCDMLVTLAAGLGWLASDRGRWVLDNQRVGAWLRLTHWEQMSLLFTSWRESTSWNDLRHTPGLLCEGEWSNDAPLARRRLLRVLERLDARSWYQINDLVALVKASDPDFQRPDGNYAGWYVREAESGQYLSGFESWDAVEGRLLRFLIEGPLFWLGAVALEARSSHGSSMGADAFRLTPAGAAWLASRMPHDPPQPARISIGDDFVVSAPLLTPLLDRFRLARFTDPLPPAGWQQRKDTLVPGPTRHRISRTSLARAREAGLKPEDAVSFLRRAATGRLPSKVAVAIERYSQLGGQVRITRGAVLRVADANILAALRSDPAIAPLLGELISAQAVIVPERHVDRLLAVLKDSGYTVDLG